MYVVSPTGELERLSRTELCKKYRLLNGRKIKIVQVEIWGIKKSYGVYAYDGICINHA